MVVTHNPLVASLADRHFVVSKRAEGSEKLEQESREESAGENHGNIEVDNDNGNGLYKTDWRRSAGAGTGPARMSTLSEVCGASRELEISRMATGGGVHSAAGLALARALLGSQSDGSTADSAD